MTQATARLALPVLSDAARVAQRNGAELYTEDDVIRLLQHVTTIEAHVPFELGEVQLTPRMKLGGLCVPWSRLQKISAHVHTCLKETLTKGPSAMGILAGRWVTRF